VARSFRQRCRRLARQHLSQVLYARTVQAMCEAIKYLVDGRTKISEIAVNSPELPVARRGGGVHFIRWGADKGEDSIYLDPDEGPGRLLSLPKGYWVELDQIKSDFRWSEGRQVRPVKIAATEFM
jgi:hypothetical protein